MTRKEQKEERKKEILMAALTLFVERGYYDTKITDIAEAVPMSAGLMFHYFESKEELLTELVKTGAEGTKSANQISGVSPDIYLTEFLRNLFSYAKKQPWVFNMFVLMGQARRPGMPKEAREIASSLGSIESTEKIIKEGQRLGLFHKGNANLMSKCFWASVQGIMEEMAADKEMKAPEPEWIISMLREWNGGEK